MLIAASDSAIASRSSSFTPFYWGCVRFMFTDYDENSLESLDSVEVFRTNDSRKFNIWKPEKNSLRMTIHNTSEKNISVLIQQEFSDGRGYELDETVDLIAGDMMNFREVRADSTLQIKIFNDVTNGDHVCRDSDILFFWVRQDILLFETLCREAYESGLRQCSGQGGLVSGLGQFMVTESWMRRCTCQNHCKEIRWRTRTTH